MSEIFIYNPSSFKALIVRRIASYKRTIKRLAARGALTDPVAAHLRDEIEALRKLEKKADEAV